MVVVGLSGAAGAGAAEAMGLMVVGLVFAFLLAFLAVALKSSILAVLCAVCFLAVTVCNRPWEAFSPEPSSDWEVLELQADDRKLAWWWVGVSVAVLTASLDAGRRQRITRGTT